MKNATVASKIIKQDNSDNSTSGASQKCLTLPEKINFFFFTNSVRHGFLTQNPHSRSSGMVQCCMLSIASTSHIIHPFCIAFYTKCIVLLWTLRRGMFI